MATLPTLLFDGDCGICARWIAYWQKLTGDAVSYRPYQAASADFPFLNEADLARAIFLVETDGQIVSGAAATFRVLASAPGHGIWFPLYRHLPGFAPLSEAAYATLAKRRGLLALITTALWGHTLVPASMRLVHFVFLRLYGLILLAAFLSLAVQIRGLVGHAGILPLDAYLKAAHAGWGASAYWRLPTLFWLDRSDVALLAATLVGALCGLLVCFNLATRLSLILAYALYLSLTYAGQVFTNYQWDQLICETAFLAIFLTDGTALLSFLLRFLLFRFLFLAGATKLLSGDPSWRNLTALDTHFFTQPLPAPLAWPASRLPAALLSAGTAATLVIEIIFVFAIFLPRRPRMLYAGSVIVFQALIIATGNFNVFNLLTILLCLFLFDDQALAHVLPQRVIAFIESHAPHPRAIAKTAAILVALVTLPVGLDRLWQPFTQKHLPGVGALTAAITPPLIVNPYGLFITTTVTRPEIVLQGSDDGTHWRDYVFKYYPGPVRRAPGWNIPHRGSIGRCGLRPMAMRRIIPGSSLSSQRCSKDGRR